MCPYMFAQFPSCGIFTPTRTISSETTSWNNRVTVPVKPQEHTNYELHGKGWIKLVPVEKIYKKVCRSLTIHHCHRQQLFNVFSSSSSLFHHSFLVSCENSDDCNMSWPNLDLENPLSTSLGFPTRLTQHQRFGRFPDFVHTSLNKQTRTQTQC